MGADQCTKRGTFYHALPAFVNDQANFLVMPVGHMTAGFDTAEACSLRSPHGRSLTASTNGQDSARRGAGLFSALTMLAIQTSPVITSSARGSCMIITLLPKMREVIPSRNPHTPKKRP